MKYLFFSILILFTFNSLYAKDKGFNMQAPLFVLDFSGTSSVTIAVHDQRAFVLDGTRLPDWVGFMRNAWGMPYIYGTGSKMPFAEEVSIMMNNSFLQKGFKSETLKTLHSQSQQEIVNSLKSRGSDFSIIVTFNEFYCDLYITPEVFYKVSIQLYNKDGDLLETVSDSAEKYVLPKNIKNPSTNLKTELPIFLSQKLATLLNSESIKKHLLK